MSSERIRELNDLLRKYGLGGQTVVTDGVKALGLEFMFEVLGMLREYDNFDADKDPPDEHDFGSFSTTDHILIWKIDYYAPDMIGGSSDPSDPNETARVLTLMLAIED
jgi:hypothetical protein